MAHAVKLFVWSPLICVESNALHYRSWSYLQHPVHRKEKRYVRSGQPQSWEHQEHGDERRTGDGRSSDTRQGCRQTTSRDQSFSVSKSRQTEGNARYIPYCDDFSYAQVNAVHLRYEDGRHGFVQSCSVHVHCSPHGKHEPGHTFVYLDVFFQAVKCNW